MDTKNKKNGSSIGGLVFVGCMFIGMGIGSYFDDGGAGTLVGMGVGFVAMAVIMLFNKKDD